MKFAYDYDILELKKQMEEFCIKNLSVSNVVCFANSKIESDEFYQKCFDLLFKCMKDGNPVMDIEELDKDMQRKLFLQAFTKLCNN
uniref:Uncharacterized protein n=1 Tax=Panagrolaimus sp. ES5 TaxID=591445 RepID=A0AC34FKI6_9BILA